MSIENSSLSRRTLVAAGGAAMVAGATLAHGTAGRANASEQVNGVQEADSANVGPIAPEQAPDSWDYEADIVVVGSGGAGGAAAVQAAQLGAKTIVLEKGAWGGTCRFTEAWAAPYNPPMSLEADMSWESTFPSAISHKDWRVARAIVERHGDTAQWLQDYCGVVFSQEQSDSCVNMFKLRFGEDWTPEVFHMGIPIDPDDPEGGWQKWHPSNGIGFTNAFEKKAEELGVQIMTQTPAVALVMDDGAVVGVKARDAEGRDMYVKGAVILACGGYAANDDMLKYYLPTRWYDNFGSYGGVESNTGDGQRMAQGAGAILYAMDEIELYDGGASYPLGPTVLYEAAKQAARQPSLQINKFCQRFFNEATPIGDYVTGQAVQKGTQPFATTYTILDDSCITMQGIIDTFRPIICEYPVPWFDEQIQERIEDGTVKKADTLEELAELLGLDSEAFVKVVDDYNALCDAGEDTQFFKPAIYLHALRQPPYYGIEEHGGGTALNTWGGLRTTPDRRVYSTDYEVIPGLYGAGEVCAYGAHNTEAMTAGRIAAETAASELGL